MDSIGKGSICCREKRVSCDTAANEFSYILSLMHDKILDVGEVLDQEPCLYARR